MIVVIMEILFSIAFGVGYFKTTMDLMITLDDLNITNSTDPNFPYAAILLQQYFD